MRRALISIIISFLVFISFGLKAQEKQVTPKDTIAAAVAKLSKTVQVLDKIKISGYIQAQFQVADTLGAKSFDGGDFANLSSKRFMVRRGYFKMAYNGGLSTYVLQINVNEKGFTLRDAYFSLKDPWLNAFSLTGGIFMRPFGCELNYSTSQRESPELSRINQVLFPGERDLGTMLTFQMPEKSPFHFLKLDAGLFSGNGTSAESDDKLDFIGRLGISEVSANKKISYGLGFSYYNGSVCQLKKSVYEMTGFNDTMAFKKLATDTTVSKYYKRNYFGIDGQFSIKTALGTTTFRGDFVTGKQPGDSASFSPSGAVNYSLYLRNFAGMSFYLIQAIPHSIHSIVIKYDYYDPNSTISGNQIGLKPKSSIASGKYDVAYYTWGFGYVADISKNLRMTLYYDLVRNETSSNVKKFGVDQKDNVFTARVQYKF